MDKEIDLIEKRIVAAGMPVAAFLRTHDIPASTWYSWKKKFKPEYTRWNEVLAAVKALETDAS